MSCKHYSFTLKMEDRHFIKSKKHNNCVLCLVDAESPMTQEEVAKYFHLSKMRICQIEKRAIQKLERRLEKLNT